VANVVAKRETLGELARCSPLPFVAMTYVMFHLGAETSLLSFATFLTIVLLNLDNPEKKAGGMHPPAFSMSSLLAGITPRPCQKR
jgi:hypothetical protein